MIKVGIKELKERLSGYLSRVRHGEEIVVTDRGREIVLITPISRERRAVNNLMAMGRVKWAGGKPAGLSGLKVKGKPVSKTILEERR